MVDVRFANLIKSAKFDGTSAQRQTNCMTGFAKKQKAENTEQAENNDANETNHQISKQHGPPKHDKHVLRSLDNFDSQRQSSWNCRRSQKQHLTNTALLLTIVVCFIPCSMAILHPSPFISQLRYQKVELNDYGRFFA